MIQAVQESVDPDGATLDRETSDVCGGERGDDVEQKKMINAKSSRSAARRYSRLENRLTGTADAIDEAVKE